MKNAIVKLGFCLLFFCASHATYAAIGVHVDRVSPAKTNSTAVDFIVKFDSPVTGFINTDVTLSGAASGGIVAANISVSANATPGWFDLHITSLTVNGPLNVSIATNVTVEGNDASTGGTPSITFDNIGPQPTIAEVGPDPTTGSNQIKFTITWDEPIFTSFPVAALDLSTSDTGLGTLTAAIVEIAPNDKTKYEVTVTVPATADAPHNAILLIPSGSLVKDEAGNNNRVGIFTAGQNTVTYAGVAPTIKSPPTATPLPNGFIINGEVLSDGGVATVTRGSVWKAGSSGVGAGDHKTQHGTGEGTFTSGSITGGGIVAETQYVYNTWVDNGIGGLIFAAAEQTIWTLSLDPNNHSPVTATAVGTGQIDLSFTKFGGNTNADGLIILRQENSAPTDADLADGKAPIAANMPLIIATITGAGQVNTNTYSDFTVQQGKLYFYAVVPFSWDETSGGNPNTYNYKQGFATSSARAFSKKSRITFDGAPTTVSYVGKTNTSITNASHGVTIGTFTLRDGDGTNDSDNLGTELKTLTIHVDQGLSMIRALAILDGGSTIHDAGTPDGSGNITFNLNRNELVTEDNNANAVGSGSPDVFDIIASFDDGAVVDGGAIQITITGATTYISGVAGQTASGSGWTSGSDLEFPNGGGASATTAMNIIATKIELTELTAPINPNSNFALRVTALDAQNKVDTNGGGTVTLTIGAGSGDGVLSSLSSLTSPALVSGTYKWLDLRWSKAGNGKKIHAVYSVGGLSQDITFNVTSFGVIINGPNETLCFNTVASGNNTAGDPTFKTLSLPITIEESDDSDFSAGSNQTLSLALPDGFIFNTLAPPTVTSVGGEISTTAAFDRFVGDNIIRIKYNITTAGTTGPNDKITISNIKVKYTDTVAVTSKPILRVDGSAVQDKNMEVDLRSHGVLSASDGPKTVDFENVNVDPALTSHSKTGGAIVLRGKELTPTPGTLSGAGVAFSGDGISFESGEWKFFPSSVNLGSHPITFTYTYNDATKGNGCISNSTKVYNVFSTIINGLADTYCANGTTSTLTTPVNSIPLFINCPLTATPVYVNSDFRYKYKDVSGIWQLFPSQTSFNIQDPAFADEITANKNATTGVSFLEVSVWYPSQCPLTYGDLFWITSRVTVNPIPLIQINSTFPYGICSTEQPAGLSGTLYDKDHNFDEFWASANGTSLPKLNNVVQGTTLTGWQLHPDLANSTSSDVVIMINYKHRDHPTQCVNEVQIPINVWRKPPKVPIAKISVRSNDGDVSAEFCQGETITAFSIIPPLTNFYRWYDATNVNGVAPEGATSFNPQTFLPSTNSVPNPGTTTFNVSQAEHRQTFTFFGSTFILHPGCESDQQALTVQIFAPTVINFGPTKTICEGNPVLLSTLGATITSPFGTLGGTWSSPTNADPNAFKDGVTTSAVFPDADTYTPTVAEYTAPTRDFKLTLESVVQPSGPCGKVSKDVIIKVSPGVTISFPELVVATDPIRRCADTDLKVETKVVPNTLSFHWEEDGSGDIDPLFVTDKAETVYHPNVTELNVGGSVTMTVVVADPDGPGPCDVTEKDVVLLISQPPRIDAGADFDICADKPINLNGQKTPGASSATSFLWTHNGGGSLANPNNLLTAYNPSAAENPGNVAVQGSTRVTFTLTSDDPVFPNVCGALTDDVTITIHHRSLPPIATAPDPYCVGQVIQPLRTEPVEGAAIAWYTDPSLSLASQLATNGSSTLASGLLANAEKKVTYYATQIFDKSSSFAGCESTATALTIKVNPLPVPFFTYANRCLGDFMEFTNSTTLQAPIDPLDPPRSIVGYQWNFDDGTLNTDIGSGAFPDPTQGGRTKGTYENPLHQFEKTGNYRVKVTAFTSDGCSASFAYDPDPPYLQTPIPVGPVPVTDFGVKLQCEADNTQFTSSSGLAASVPVTYAWAFGDPSSSSNTATTQNALHKFTAVNTYDVTLTITTNLNCTNTITKKTSIFPYVKTFPYIENFESPNHGWVAEGEVTTSGTTVDETSWNLLTSAGSIASDPNVAAGPKFWATHTAAGQDKAGNDVYYYNNERSVIYGPCVDMTNLDRPVLAIDYFNDTEEKGDGVYIEYLDESNPANVWTRLGDNVKGLNWFNQSSIGGLSLLGGVGQDLSQFGWSGSTKEWTTGRYNLDDYATMTRVRFRVVFGSNVTEVSEETYDGFGFDYFKLEPRNRVVLVENFTSKSTSTVFTQNRDAFQSFPSAAASNEVVKIEYHTGIPVVAGETPDAIYNQNPMDPNARASFYGLSAVPRGYIDGYSNLAGNGMFNAPWASTYYSTESLKTSPLDIVIDDPEVLNGTIRVKGTVLAKEIDLQSNKYSLYVAIVEEQVGTDHYLLRKMLPSASGLKVPTTAKGGSFTFDQSWTIDRSYVGTDTPKLIAVAFVQSDVASNDGQRQVLQAAYKINTAPMNFTTGLEIPFLEQTALFPNPADRLVNIELPQATVNGVEVSLIDQLGRPVKKSAIGAGQRSVTIDISELAGTVYLVQLKENGVFTTRRLLITHKH